MPVDPASPPSSSEPTFVLLHGSGLEPWIWEPLQARLPFRSVALEVPSRRRGTNPTRCAREILLDPDFPSRGPVVLVLHSLAGVLEAVLATSLGRRLEQVVHLATVVPEAGRSFAKAMGFPARLALPLLFRFHPDGLAPSRKMLLQQLCGDLEPEMRDRLIDRFHPEFPGLFLEPVPRCTAVPTRGYVVCARDKSVPPRQQRATALRLGARIREMECGHLPMLSHPGILARHLEDLVGVAVPSLRLTESVC